MKKKIIYTVMSLFVLTLIVFNASKENTENSSSSVSLNVAELKAECVDFREYFGPGYFGPMIKSWCEKIDFAASPDENGYLVWVTVQTCYDAATTCTID